MVFLRKIGWLFIFACAGCGVRETQTHVNGQEPLVKIESANEILLGSAESIQGYVPDDVQFEVAKVNALLNGELILHVKWKFALPRLATAATWAADWTLDGYQVVGAELQPFWKQQTGISRDTEMYSLPLERRVYLFKLSAFFVTTTVVNGQQVAGAVVVRHIKVDLSRIP